MAAEGSAIEQPIQLTEEEALRLEAAEGRVNGLKLQKLEALGTYERQIRKAQEHVDAVWKKIAEAHEGLDPKAVYRLSEDGKLTLIRKGEA